MDEPWYRNRDALEAAVAEHGSVRKAAAATGVPTTTFRKWLDPDRWRTQQRRYGKTAAAAERNRRSTEQTRQRRRAAGLCPMCGRPTEFGLRSCARCGRYRAERRWLGYSSIPLAKGAEG